jgi:hypothetical protein
MTQAGPGGPQHHQLPPLDLRSRCVQGPGVCRGRAMTARRRRTQPLLCPSLHSLQPEFNGEGWSGETVHACSHGCLARQSPVTAPQLNHRQIIAPLWRSSQAQSGSPGAPHIITPWPGAASSRTEPLQMQCHYWCNGTVIWQTGGARTQRQAVCTRACTRVHAQQPAQSGWHHNRDLAPTACIQSHNFSASRAVQTGAGHHSRAGFLPEPAALCRGRPPPLHNWRHTLCLLFPLGAWKPPDPLTRDWCP